MDFYSEHQLAEIVGKSVRTIRHHIQQGWLKKEPKTPGVRGPRVSLRNAQKWQRIHYPTKPIS